MPLLPRFKPDLLIWYYGFDTHLEDYGSLGLSEAPFFQICDLMINAAAQMGVPLQVVLGGGSLPYLATRTIPEIIKLGWEKSGSADKISWEELNERGYYVIPTDPEWEKIPAGLIEFYEDPEGHPLSTPTGKLEFYSQRLADHFPDDKERPPSPKWIERGETHDERLSSERANLFPLLMMSNHGRWRTHAQGDDITWTREAPTCKVLGADGYKYEPIWSNPLDAAKRGIKDGDIVKAFNERGIVLVGARVWERVMPGVVYVDHGARHDPIIPGKVDRGGAINSIAPNGITSRNAVGQATSGYLVDVQKVKGEEWDAWRKDYPEAFARDYHHAAGPRFNAWVEGGMG